jgi:hypothetical protein
MLNIKPLFLLLPVLFLLQSSTENIYDIDKSWLPARVKTRSILALKDSTIETEAGGRRSVDVLYTGCGGLVIGHQGEAFMTDPYYTAHNYAEAFSFIRADEDNETKVLKKISSFINPHRIAAVFVSHSHYDHLEDLPGLLFNKQLASRVQIHGSPSTTAAVQNFTVGHQFTNSDKFQYRHRLPLQEGTFIQVTPHIRVMPIESSHAPHFYGVKVMDGPTKEKHFRDFDEPFEFTTALNWREGSSYSYLVHLVSDAPKDTFRLFIQTSASNAPFGFPPPEELTAGRKVDLAIICLASYKYVNHYPERLLDTLRPKKTIIVHWEDFFNDMYVHEPKVVGLSPEIPFMQKLESLPWVGKGNLKKHFVMPKPLVKLKVRY